MQVGKPQVGQALSLVKNNFPIIPEFQQTSDKFWCFIFWTIWVTKYLKSDEHLSRSVWLTYVPLGTIGKRYDKHKDGWGCNFFRCTVCCQNLLSSDIGCTHQTFHWAGELSALSPGQSESRTTELPVILLVTDNRLSLGSLPRLIQ